MNKVEQFRIMVQLALIDNKFEEQEDAFIRELAQTQGVSSHELNGIIQEELSKKEMNVSANISMDFETKIEILSDMVRIMKVDGKVYLSEIKFCEMVAKMFGFKEKSIGLLSGMIHETSTGATSSLAIQEKMKELTYN